MPTVLRWGPYRVHFFSEEGNEPPHVHVDRDRCSAKFWLDPIAATRNVGFPEHEMTRIRRILVEHEDEIREAWHEHFGT
jgi:hypothetical protein